TSPIVRPDRKTKPSAAETSQRLPPVSAYSHDEPPMWSTIIAKTQNPRSRSSRRSRLSVAGYARPRRTAPAVNQPTPSQGGRKYSLGLIVRAATCSSPHAHSDLLLQRNAQVLRKSPDYRSGQLR